MIYRILIILLFLLVFSSYSIAADFLGVPLISGGTDIRKTDDRMELKVDISHDNAMVFYKNVLKDLSDIKFREWKDATYIEDNSNRPWHSITISKGTGNKTTVVITKDSWTWIFSTLILRYMGVFVVLMVLFSGMSISGKIISISVKNLETGGAAR